MKIINFKKMWICLLIFSMILQSCSVYKSKSGTFDEAIALERKVKATTKIGDKEIIKKIEKINGVYYGLIRTTSGYKRTALSENNYKKIQLKSEPASTFLTAGIIIIPVLIILGAIAVNNMDFEIDENDL